MIKLLARLCICGIFATIGYHYIYGGQYTADIVWGFLVLWVGINGMIKRSDV